jgi:hypothetical protein
LNVLNLDRLVFDVVGRVPVRRGWSFDAMIKSLAADPQVAKEGDSVALKSGDNGGEVVVVPLEGRGNEGRPGGSWRP